MSIGRTSTFLTLFLIWHSHSCLWYLPISSCFLEVRNTVPDVAENCRNTHTNMYTLEGYTYTRIFHENTTRHPHCLSSLNRNRHLNLRHTYMCMYACRNHWLVPLQPFISRTDPSQFLRSICKLKSFEMENVFDHHQVLVFSFTQLSRKGNGKGIEGVCGWKNDDEKPTPDLKFGIFHFPPLAAFVFSSLKIDLVLFRENNDGWLGKQRWWWKWRWIYVDRWVTGWVSGECVMRRDLY